MRTLKQHQFGEVTAYRLGYAPVGNPFMTVCVYVVKDLFIDTGQSHMRQSVLALGARHHISAALLTHHHEDHSGNAAALKNRFQIPVMAHRLTIEKLGQPYRIFPYQHWIWGKTAPVCLDFFPENGFSHGNLRFEMIHAPGHSKDHCVFLESSRGWLFSGDLYLGSRIKFFRADERITDQIASLKKVLTYDFDALFCSHNPVPENGKAHLARKLQFLEDFYGNVADCACQGLNETEIMQTLGLKEEHLVKVICFGNVSMKNMVRSVMASLGPH